MMNLSSTWQALKSLCTSSRRDAQSIGDRLDLSADRCCFPNVSDRSVDPPPTTFTDSGCIRDIAVARAALGICSVM